MNLDKILTEAAKVGAREAIEWLAEEGVELSGEAIEAAAKALRGVLSAYPRTVNARDLEVDDQRQAPLDAPEPGGW